MYKGNAMNRLLGFVWIYLKLVILPLSILASFKHPESRTIFEVYDGYVAGINVLMIGVIKMKYWGIVEALAIFITYPMTLVTWLIPGWIKYPFLAVATIAGNAGIFVVLWAACWWIPLPRFLRADTGKVRQEAA
ncbi:hypothetical protein CWC48_29875 [Pseudomonas sp. S10E 269]|nr:hypothetical protein CWC49_29980 [Pseudomonas sp. S09F 262]PJK37539.1 hypothetical protein CWC48_29875 [Pseudomonas sp. S10E 269]